MIHVRFLEPEALREHLRAAADPALSRTSDTGALDDAAALVLTRTIFAAGEGGGVLDFEGVDEWEARFLELCTLVLADGALASQLLEGGWLDRRGIGRHAFGSLPLRVVQRQVSRDSLRTARQAVQLGWESELINLLESCALRAARAEEEHVVLLRDAAAHRATQGRATMPGSSLSDFVKAAAALEATDVTLVPGAPPTAHGSFGAKALETTPLTGEALHALLDAVLGGDSRARAVPFVAVVGEGDARFRLVVSAEQGVRTASVRLLAARPFTLDELGVSPLVQAPLLALKGGLVLLSGQPGTGRSTLFSAVLGKFASTGRRVASLEEPVAFLQSEIRQTSAGVDAGPMEFARTARLQPLDVVGFDLLDDALALELALDTAMDGRLAVCVFRAPNVAMAVHRAGVLDARFHRRRVAEGLAAFCEQRLSVYDGRRTLELEFHVPTVALRRHIRAHETPPPPVAFENEQVG